MNEVRARPSAAHRWCGAGCRGSVALAARYPDVPSEWADKGTRLHGLGALVLQGGAPVYGPDDAKVVDPYVEEVRRVHAQHPGATLHIEQERTWALNPLLQGTPDAVLVDHATQRVIVWDLKTGWSLVEVVENWQLLSYATMVTPPKYTADLRIVQPLPYHPNGRVRSWVVPWEQLSRRAVILQEALSEALVPGARLVPGAHCRYCAGLLGCPAARAVSLTVVDYAQTDPLELPVTHMGHELRVLREAAKLLELRVAALEEQVEVKLRAGQAVPGAYMKMNRGGGLKWNAPEQTIRSVLQMLTGKDPAIPKLPTPTQLKDAGISADMLKPFTRYQEGRMVVATDLYEAARTAFQSENTTS